MMKPLIKAEVPKVQSCQNWILELPHIVNMAFKVNQLKLSLI
jgi:hypothetical protein